MFLESEIQVVDFLENHSASYTGAKIIAVSPFAVFELDKRKITYSVPEEYHNSRDLYAIGTSNYGKTEDMCRIMDDALKDASKSASVNDIRPALFSYYSIKVLVDAVSFRAFQIARILEKEKPDEVVFYESRTFPFGITETAPFLMFDNRESLYSKVLALSGEKYGNIRFTPIPSAQDAPAPSDTSQKHFSSMSHITRSFKLAIQSYESIYSLAYDCKYYGFKNALYYRFLSGKKKPILLFGAPYNWDLCLDDLMANGLWPIIRVRDDLEYWLGRKGKLDFNPDEVVAGLKNDTSFRMMFVFDGVDLFPIFESRVAYLTMDLTSACFAAYFDTRRALKRGNARFFVTSTLATCTSQAAAKAAKELSVPVVAWQHGNCGYMEQPMVYYCDILPSDAMLVFGPGVVSKYDGVEKGRVSMKMDGVRARLIPVGSTRLEALIERFSSAEKEKSSVKNPSMKTILYVTTAFQQNNLYLSAPPVLSDIGLFRMQKEIVDALGSLRNSRIIVKTHDNAVCRETPLRVYAALKGYSNMEVIRNEKKFSDLLPEADVVVIDFPSTVLLESLATKKPIFVFMPFQPLDAMARELLERRAFTYDSLSLLLSDVRSFVEEGARPSKADLLNYEFMKSFGSGFNGKRASINAVEFLKSMF